MSIHPMILRKHHADTLEIARESKRLAEPSAENDNNLLNINNKIYENKTSQMNNQSMGISCDAFPEELLFDIFKLLSLRDQDAGACVCRRWRIILEDKRFKEIKDFCFGKTKWLKYFGDIGVELPLPPNIGQILNSDCIFWPNKKVRNTHLLVLVPKQVNGRPFHLDSLEELIKSPKSGHKTEYKYYDDDVKKELGTKGLESHWFLMTRDIIPGSRSKPYEDQKSLVQKHVQNSKIPYELPKILEAAAAILMHHVETEERIYSDNPQTYTRCQEKVNHNRCPAAIGSFSSWGLSVSHCISDWHALYGVCCVRRV